MATIGTVLLDIQKVPNSLKVIPEVTYVVTYDDDDRQTNRAYNEVVELIGVDDGPFNTRDEVIRFGTASFATDTLRADGQESEQRFHTRDDAQLRELNEDRPGRDEIRAVVTLQSGTITVARSSNLVIDDFNPAHA
jgi:hypothetical protein